jgi:hypothetical protein
VTSSPAFQRLRAGEWLALGALLVAGRAWIAVDQALLPQRLLMPAFLTLVLLLMAGFFALARPSNPFALARTVALVTGCVTAVLIVVQHVIVRFDLTMKSGVILAATVAFPFVTAAGYKWVRTRNESAHAL